MNCIFCEIAKGNIPSIKVYENEQVFAFRDIEPKAPTHVVLIPKDHYANILDLDLESSIHKELLKAIKEIAKIENISDTGFRVVTNCKGDGGQSVDHLHYHILGGRNMQWPPG